MGDAPSRTMPNPPESPLSVDSDSAISDDTAVKMEHPEDEELGRSSSQPGGATRLSPVQEGRAESLEEPEGSHQKEVSQPPEGTSVTQGDAADSRPEANPSVADVPQGAAGRALQPSVSQLNPESHLRSEIGTAMLPRAGRQKRIEVQWLARGRSRLQAHRALVFPTSRCCRSKPLPLVVG